MKASFNFTKLYEFVNWFEKIVLAFLLLGILIFIPCPKPIDFSEKVHKFGVTDKSEQISQRINLFKEKVNINVTLWGGFKENMWNIFRSNIVYDLKSFYFHWS